MIIVNDFGENYVQELTQKIEENNSLVESRPIRWHMIGHLQKNKVKYLIGRAALIHSVDSVPLAEQIEKEAAKREQGKKHLISTKFEHHAVLHTLQKLEKEGFEVTLLDPHPDGVIRAAQEIASFSHVRVLGLMTSAPFTEEPETNRVYFRGLNSLAKELAAKELLSVTDPDFHGPVLSMGMTGDFEVAVEEGATMVRVGTAIFGRRNYE